MKHLHTKARISPPILWHVFGTYTLPDSSEKLSYDARIEAPDKFQAMDEAKRRRPDVTWVILWANPADAKYGLFWEE